MIGERRGISPWGVHESEILLRKADKCLPLPSLTSGELLDDPELIQVFPRLRGKTVKVTEASRELNCYAHAFRQEKWFGPYAVTSEMDHGVQGCCFEDVFPSSHIRCWRIVLRRLGYTEGRL